MGVLTNSDDLDLYTSAVQVYIRNITEQLAIQGPQYQMVYPNPAILIDNVLVQEFIKSDVGSNMHFQGHCRMAPLNQGGVVDRYPLILPPPQQSLPR